ncbi:MAG: Deoxycytidine triphosphate deaminase [Candidatus Aerophobetes bacterium ADurb.Bin490]|nr:MAG: Deoxycytidine triphosphate deaminase [Candidatus Aerophobetes bacterium ADurb.Bin490]
MGVMNDKWIKMMAKKGMIEPFQDKQVAKGVISSGVSSYGYDMRISDEFKIFNPASKTIVDPKSFDISHFIDYKGKECIIPPNSYVLAKSVEYFRIPRDIVTITFGKSTYARSGIFMNITPFEPEWEGFVTISISNLTPLPAKLYANEGIAQVLFLKAEEPCEVSYADKKGKYQAQKKITIAKIKK